MVRASCHHKNITYRPASPASLAEPVNENSPLLSKSSNNDSQCLRSAVGQDAEEEISTKVLAWVMTSVWIGTFCAGLDGTIMATLAAPIATSFNSLQTLAWLATAYLIGQASAQPLSGKLTDIYSRRSGLIISNVLFGLGNFLCGCSSKEWMMILGRFIAGIGGGCLITLATIVASDLIPLRRRGLWQGTGNFFWGIGNGLGGVVGGYFNDKMHWRWAFWVQVPLSAFSLIMMLSNFDQPQLKRSRITSLDVRFARVDLLGCLLLVATMTSLLLGITAGGNIVPWDHPLVLVSLSLAVVLLCGFIYTEQKVAVEPILPLHFLKNRNVLCGCLTLWLHHMTTFSTLFNLPLFFRIRGVSTAKAGGALFPLSVGFVLGSLSAGAVTVKTGRYRNLLWFVMLLMIMASISASVSGERSPLWLPLVGLGLLGFALSAVLTVTWLAMTSVVEPQDQAVVTSLSFVFRATGSVVGIAIVSAIYQNVLEKTLWARLGQFDSTKDLIHVVKHDLDAISTLPSNIQTIVKALKITYGHSHSLAVDDTMLYGPYVSLDAPKASAEPTLMSGKSCTFETWATRGK